MTRVAAAEFAECGYARASLNRIIARCGMSKSSFYHFVPSKKDLFDYVVRVLVGEMVAAMTIPAPEEFEAPDYWARVETVFAGMVDVALSDEAFGTVGRMFYTDTPAGENAVTTASATIRSWVEEVLRVGRRCGAVSGDVPADLQFFSIFGVLQALDRWVLAHLDDHDAAGLRAVADSQFAAVRRMLEPARLASRQDFSAP